MKGRPTKAPCRSILSRVRGVAVMEYVRYLDRNRMRNSRSFSGVCGDGGHTVEMGGRGLRQGVAAKVRPRFFRSRAWRLSSPTARGRLSPFHGSTTDDGLQVSDNIHV